MTNKFISKKYSASPQQEVEEVNSDKRFKMVRVDADTILHSSAISLQQSYINVKHISSGRVKRFENKTDFGIRGDKIIPNKWLDNTNQEMLSKGKSAFEISDFEIEECFEIKPEFKTHEEAIEYGLQSIGYAVGGLKKFADSEEYCLIISGGTGNYRNNLARTLKYKGNRSDKPILYSELKQAMIDQYKSKVILADFCEAEDLCGWYAKQQEDKFGEDFEKWEECISYIDKDVDHVYAPSINYRHFEDGFRFPTKLECAKSLVSQIVAGDESCDNIRGLPNLTEEVTKKFGLRKANGCGKTTAENLIADCETEKDMYERAVFAYQSYFGMEPVEFEAWDGNTHSWTWLDFMKETAVLVKMQDFDGQVWDVEDKLKDLGIDYSEKLFPEPERVFVGNENHLLEIEALLKGIVKEDMKGCKQLKSKEKDAVFDIIKEKLSSIDFEGHYAWKQFEKSTGKSVQAVNPSRRSLREFLIEKGEFEEGGKIDEQDLMEVFDCQETKRVWERDVDRHRWYNVVECIDKVLIDGEDRFFKGWFYDITGDNSASDMDLQLPTVDDYHEVYPVEKMVTAYE